MSKVLTAGILGLFCFLFYSVPVWADMPDSSLWYTTNTPHFAHGPTGPGEDEANEGAISGWDSSYAPNGAWSDSEKTTNDPCPSGFRVPTNSQWEGVIDNNIQLSIGSWTDDSTNYSSAIFLGNDLMLPAAGYRASTSGTLYSRGNRGYYRSSSESVSNYAWRLYFTSGDAGTNDLSSRLFGLSVRCISDTK